jgi:hypothetical protein
VITSAWVRNLNTFEWVQYEFVGSRPGYTTVTNGTREMTVTNSLVRFTNPNA